MQWMMWTFFLSPTLILSRPQTPNKTRISNRISKIATPFVLERKDEIIPHVSQAFPPYAALELFAFCFPLLISFIANNASFRVGFCPI